MSSVLVVELFRTSLKRDRIQLEIELLINQALLKDLSASNF